MTKSLPIAATRVDISARPVPAPVMPVGWTPELLAAVEAGQISYRRAQVLAADPAPRMPSRTLIPVRYYPMVEAMERLDRIDRNSAGRLPSDNILASGDHMALAYHEGRLRFLIVDGSVQLCERKARFVRRPIWTLPGVQNTSPRPVAR